MLVREKCIGMILFGKARFTVISAECIRLEYSDREKFVNEPSMFAVNRSTNFGEFEVVSSKKQLAITTKRMKLIYRPDAKRFNKNNLMIVVNKGNRKEMWRPAMKNTGNLGGTIQTLDMARRPVDLGEGVLSREGWYVLDDSRGHLLKDGWVVSREQEAGLDWYFFGYGRDYKSGLRALTEIGGKVPLPRKYVMGAWYSRYWPYSSEDYRKIVKEYDKQGFPLDVMVLDMDWHRDGWTGWSVNRKLLPDFEELLDWLHENGLFITLNVHPGDGVGPHEDMYSDFMRGMGKDPDSKECLLFDAGKKKYLDILFKFTHEPLEKNGVDFWWLDWQQFTRNQHLFTQSIGDLTNLAWLNHYYYHHTGKDGLRGQSFSRWAGWGDHRHPIHFSGDADSGWDMLSFQVPFTSTAGNMGCFFWSHDIGGHAGTRNAESYSRWCQFGATTAALRSHSTRDKVMDRRPWKYPKWASDSMLVSFKLRSVLFPYIYSSAYQCYADSLPLNRPMYLEFPDKDRAYRNPQQYLFGDAMLVCPIVSPGTGHKRVATSPVWFPGGVWYNWFTSEMYEGERDELVAADIDEFPIYVKGGVPIPTQPYTRRMTTSALKELVIRCYPGVDGQVGEFILYEDDGLTEGYKDGKSGRTRLSYLKKGKRVTVVINPVEGAYGGMVDKRSYVIELAATKNIASAKLANKALEVKYDCINHINRIKIPEKSTSEKVEVKIQAESIDQDIVREIAIARRVNGVVASRGEYEITEELKANIIRLSKLCNDKRLKEEVLKTVGVGFVKKAENPDMFGGNENYYFYAAKGLIDENRIRYTIEDRCSDEVREYSSEDMFVLGAVSLTKKYSGGFNVGFGIAAKREVEVKFSIDDSEFSLRRVIETKRSYLNKWNIVGPFIYDEQVELNKQIFAPEKESVDLKARYTVAEGQKSVWQKAGCGHDGIINLSSIYSFYNHIAYAVTYVSSPLEQQVKLGISRDSGIVVWFNGSEVYSADRLRVTDHPAEILTAQLKKGVNTILLKISQGVFDWQEYRIWIESIEPIEQSFERSDI